METNKTMHNNLPDLSETIKQSMFSPVDLNRSNFLDPTQNTLKWKV